MVEQLADLQTLHADLNCEQAGLADRLADLQLAHADLDADVHNHTQQGKEWAEQRRSLASWLSRLEGKSSRADQEIANLRSSLRAAGSRQP